MNWLYMIVMAYIVLSALRGYHRGIIKVVYSVAALLVMSAFVAFMTPLVGSALQKYPPVYDRIEAGCEKYIRERIEQRLDEGGGLEDLHRLSENILPKKLQQMLVQKSRQEIEGMLETQDIYQKAAKTAADFIVYAIAFVLSLAVIWPVLFVAGRKLNYFAKTPGIHIINMILGFFAGTAKAFLVIWIVFLMIRMTPMLPASAALTELIEENAVLKDLYEQNYLLELLQKLPVLTGLK